MACVTCLTSEGLEERVREGHHAATEFNELLKRSTLASLLDAGRVRLVWNPMVLSGEHGGPNFLPKTLQWFHGGAEERLMEVFGRPGDQPTFGVGTFGSVWCDVELVGVVGTRTFERTVRVAPWKDPRTGVWEVMLDNTLCDTW